MPYVMRGPKGEIQAVNTIMTSGMPGWEYLEEGDREYLAFLESELSKHDPFRESDIHLARVLEDLISLLIERDLIRFTDFPAAAQKRLIYRQALRKKAPVMDIIDEDRGGVI